MVTYESHSTVLQFGRGQRFSSYRFDWRFEMQDVFSWNYNCIQSAHIPSPRRPCVHRISEVGERFQPFSVQVGIGERRSSASYSYCTLTTDDDDYVAFAV